MQGNRGRDTKPELAVRRLVHAAGLRYRVNSRPEPDLRRTADLLFVGAHISVFIDGCYWHGCPEHFTMPVMHLDYWSTKIARNRSRDLETTFLLESRGWTVLRFWEHETPTSVAERITLAVQNSHPSRVAMNNVSSSRLSAQAARACGSRGKSPSATGA